MQHELQLSLSPLLCHSQPCGPVQFIIVVCAVCMPWFQVHRNKNNRISYFSCLKSQPSQSLPPCTSSYHGKLHVKDHIIPYMADERHAPDTLFFVAEEDFRLFHRHSACAPDIVGRLTEAAYAASSTSFAARTPALREDGNEPVALPVDDLYAWRYTRQLVTQPGCDLFGPPAAGTDSWKRLVGGLYEPTRKPRAIKAVLHGVSEYLEDLVKIVTAAHRKGRGDLVWLSYDANNKKGTKCKVVHASTLIAVSADGAKKLADIVPDAEEFGKDMHWDVLLLRYLEKKGEEFKASYVYPSVGHYQGFLSQSSDNEGWRPDQWNQNWIQEGTRASHAEAGRTRWLMGWQKKGVNWIREINIPEKRWEDLRWFTRTTAPAGWVDQMTAREERMREVALGKGKTPPRRIIQPVWRLQATVMEGNPQGLVSKRQKRQQRANDAGYAFRNFVPEGEEVCLTRLKKISACCQA